MNIQERLFELRDEKYAAFQAKLTPNIPKEAFIGVRVPVARNLAKELFTKGEYQEFLNQLPHQYYDENILHSLLISQIKDYDTCLMELERFLPYIDNWAVCDILSPKCFKKSKEKLIIKIKEWSLSPLTYTSRFGIEMLMSHYLDNDFQKEYLEIPAKVNLEDYYAKMMIAWFYATALSKQWDATIPYLENNILEKWIHNKTIQKAIESYRITEKQKEMLRSLKK